jgi:TonB family protein
MRFALVWFFALAGCVSAAHPAPAPIDPATADAVVAADPSVAACERAVGACGLVPAADPDPTWRLGIARLALKHAAACDGGDGVACARARAYGARDPQLARRGCDLGDGLSCDALANTLLSPPSPEALTVALRGCELRSPHGCALASQILRRGMGVPADPARADALEASRRGAARPGAPSPASLPPPPPSSQAAAPRSRPVPPTVVESRRVGGDPAIAPPDDVRAAMLAQGRTKAVAAVKICLDASGTIDALALLKSSGYRAYDQHILERMQQWRYLPVLLDGAPAAVCTAVTFIYQQRLSDQS